MLCAMFVVVSRVHLVSFCVFRERSTRKRNILTAHCGEPITSAALARLIFLFFLFSFFVLLALRYIALHRSTPRYTNTTNHHAMASMTSLPLSRAPATVTVVPVIPTAPSSFIPVHSPDAPNPSSFAPVPSPVVPSPSSSVPVLVAPASSFAFSSSSSSTDIIPSLLDSAIIPPILSSKTRLSPLQSASQNKKKAQEQEQQPLPLSPQLMSLEFQRWFECVIGVYNSAILDCTTHTAIRAHQCNLLTAIFTKMVLQNRKKVPLLLHLDKQQYVVCGFFGAFGITATHEVVAVNETGAIIESKFTGQTLCTLDNLYVKEPVEYGVFTSLASLFPAAIRTSISDLDNKSRYHGTVSEWLVYMRNALSVVSFITQPVPFMRECPILGQDRLDFCDAYMQTKHRCTRVKIGAFLSHGFAHFESFFTDFIKLQHMKTLHLTISRNNDITCAHVFGASSDQSLTHIKHSVGETSSAASARAKAIMSSSERNAIQNRVNECPLMASVLSEDTQYRRRIEPSSLMSFWWQTVIPGTILEFNTPGIRNTTQAPIASSSSTSAAAVAVSAVQSTIPPKSITISTALPASATALSQPMTETASRLFASELSTVSQSQARATAEYVAMLAQYQNSATSKSFKRADKNARKSTALRSLRSLNPLNPSNQDSSFSVASTAEALVYMCNADNVGDKYGSSSKTGGSSSNTDGSSSNTDGSSQKRKTNNELLVDPSLPVARPFRREGLSAAFSGFDHMSSGSSASSSSASSSSASSSSLKAPHHL